jgi:hypothetical protein
MKLYNLIAGKRIRVVKALLIRIRSTTFEDIHSVISLLLF